MVFLLSQADLSAQTPMGLDVVAPTNIAGSDAASVDFQNNVLPELENFVNTNLTERTALELTPAMMLDPLKLNLATLSDVRVYFVNEGAGYHNSLGFNTDLSGGVETGDPQLSFPDASSSTSYFDPNGEVVRDSNTPVSAGDYVDIGTFDAGTQLDFFLIANGANGGQNVFSTNDSANPDGLVHAIAYALPDSPYLLIGFEDLLNGGDNDFNDLLFLVDIGSANVAALTSGLEPATLLTVGAFGGVAAVIRRKRNRKQDTESA